MGSQDTGGVAEGRDQLSNVLHQQLNAVVQLVRWLVTVPISSAMQCSVLEPTERRVSTPHVNGNNMVVLGELLQLVAPGEPKLRKTVEK
jgi:hypothetical protein